MEEQLIDRGIKDFRLQEVMSRVPRHVFVQDSLSHRAYGDYPLPIGGGQTISQPYVVAKMTEALELQPTDRVLEIGTGSGYQTAILSEMAAKVFTIERVKAIATSAQTLLNQLGYTSNIIYKIFDGTYGWPDQAPYDAILVTAGGPEIPASLIKQLKDGGRLVAPVGGEQSQKLTFMIKQGEQTTQSDLGDCTFVPLIGRYGWPDE